MKYLKKYEIFDLEDWDEIDEDGTFLSWLKINYPKNKWNNIKEIDCSDILLIDLTGIENLRNLEVLDCTYTHLKK
jgi:Leucine-rich repeat (LRR) protein